VLEQWLSDPSKIGATLLLLAAVAAFYKGYVVPRWTHDAAIVACTKEKDTFIAELQAQLGRERAEKAEFKAMVLRTVEVSERALRTAETTVANTGTKS
jgi:hypothetical protein